MGAPQSVAAEVRELLNKSSQPHGLGHSHAQPAHKFRKHTLLSHYHKDPAESFFEVQKDARPILQGPQAETDPLLVPLPYPPHPPKKPTIYEEKEPTKTAAASLDSQTPREFKWN